MEVNSVHHRIPLPITYVNIILPLNPSLPSGLCSSGFPTKTLHASSISTIRAIRPVSLICLHFYFLNNIWRGIQITELLVMVSIPRLCYLVLLRYKYTSI